MTPLSVILSDMAYKLGLFGLWHMWCARGWSPETRTYKRAFDWVSSLSANDNNTISAIQIAHDLKNLKAGRVLAVKILLVINRAGKCKRMCMFRWRPPEAEIHLWELARSRSGSWWVVDQNVLHGAFSGPQDALSQIGDVKRAYIADPYTLRGWWRLSL